MKNPRLIEPQLTTPAPASREGGATLGLPETLVSDQAQRVTIAAAVGAGLWMYGLLMDTFVRPLTIGVAIPHANVVIELAAIAMSAAMFLYVHLSSASAQKKADVGLLFMVMNAIAVALLNSWTLPPAGTNLQLSWSTVVILVSAMIMPSTPRKMFVTAAIAASMDPLAMGLAHLRGFATPSISETLVLFAPNYACAVVAVLPSRVLLRIGHRLRQAQELGSYQLVELLGRGGMGEVWRARHRLLARHAAIKLVRPELLGAHTDAEAQRMLRRFEREAQATAALSSPHTIRLFDFGVTADRTFYYVMELLEGRDLESLVREFGPLSAGRAVFLLTQISHSLADAHARGLIHRDITPSNVYVCRMGLDYDFVKVLDFGLVTFDDQRSVDRTLVGGRHVTTGTPAFMAPEIILDSAIDVRTDVYAFGCVAYYLLTGQLVFEGKTPMNLFIQHLQAAPTPISERTELAIPRDLEALVMSCLEKDPARRPQSAVELLHRLEACRLPEAWTSDNARVWWERHLAELTGPLSLEPAEPAVTSQGAALRARTMVKTETERTTQVRFA